MKRRTAVLVSGLVAGAVILGGAGAVLAGMTPDVSSGAARNSGGSTTMSGSGVPGMMGTPSPGAMMGTPGPGAMMGVCYPGGMMGGVNQSNPQGKTLTLSGAVQRVQRYIALGGQATLAVDEVMEFQNNVYAIVKDKATGHGAFEVLVNKATGAVFPEYGPAMMWNTQYGMMGSMMGYQQPRSAMTVSPAQATQIARAWLTRQPDSTTEAPEQFPGYYTLHILKHGMVTGMLSVNGYSGQVWFHTWHGALIQMKDLHA